MTDVVERLKEQSGWRERSEHMDATAELLWDAIDEIENWRHQFMVNVNEILANARLDRAGL